VIPRVHGIEDGARKTWQEPDGIVQYLGDDTEADERRESMEWCLKFGRRDHGRERELHGSLFVWLLRAILKGNDQSSGSLQQPAEDEMIAQD
jgi:hypothetical protein